MLNGSIDEDSSEEHGHHVDSGLIAECYVSERTWLYTDSAGLWGMLKSFVGLVHDAVRRGVLQNHSRLGATLRHAVIAADG